MVYNTQEEQEKAYNDELISRNAWLKDRQNGLSATRMAKVLGTDPWTPKELQHCPAQEVFLEMLEESEEAQHFDAENTREVAMEQGKALEDFLLKCLWRRTGITFARCSETVIRHPECTYETATPDAVAHDSPHILAECKTFNASVLRYLGPQLSDYVHSKFMAQMQWQMHVCAASDNYLVTLAKDRNRCGVWLVQRDQEVIDVMREFAKRLWFNHILPARQNPDETEKYLPQPSDGFPAHHPWRQWARPTIKWEEVAKRFHRDVLAKWTILKRGNWLKKGHPEDPFDLEHIIEMEANIIENHTHRND